MRYMLKVLLMYKGYMYETRGKGVSLTTKVWAVLMKGEHYDSQIKFLKLVHF